MTGGFEAVVKLDRGDARVGLAPRAGTQFDERVRLFRAAADNPAGPVILERAADQLDVVGQQRRAERVAGKAGVGLAVEREMAGVRAVDATAGGQTAHGATFASQAKRTALIAWLSVSRSTLTHRRQPLA